MAGPSLTCLLGGGGLPRQSSRLTSQSSAFAPGQNVKFSQNYVLCNTFLLRGAFYDICMVPLFPMGRPHLSDFDENCSLGVIKSDKHFLSYLVYNFLNLVLQLAALNFPGCSTKSADPIV